MRAGHSETKTTDIKTMSPTRKKIFDYHQIELDESFDLIYGYAYEAILAAAVV